MAERNAKTRSRYEWQGSAIILSVLFMVQAFAPVAVSDAGFDEMTICQDSPSTLGGVCDDRTDGDDGTTDVTDWVEGMFHFNMTSPTEIQFQASWAIREWDKSGMGLFNSVSMANALQSDNIMANDGLPADVLRSAFDENTDPNDASSPTIQESLLSEIDGSISSFLSNWGGSSTPDTTWSDRIFIPDDSGSMSGVDCELDPLLDSDGNAFEPPICISTNVNITLPISSTYGLNGVSASNLDTALEGLLVMGSQITTNFDVRVNPGHKGTYSIQPPAYATVVDAGGWVGEEVDEVADDGSSYKSALWSVDNRVNPSGVLQADLDMKMGYRDTDGTDVVDVSPLDKSLDLRVSVDLSDESNSFIEVVVGIYQIQSSSMNSWGVPPLMPANKATIPVITADGIRMAYHTGLMDLGDLSSNIPVSGIGQALASSKEGLNVAMGDFTWTSVAQAPLDPGGLNHTHGFGCSRGVHYCMEGTVAMDDSYPVYMRSVSHTFPLSLADLLGGNLGDSGFMNSVSGDDLRNLLNSGLQFSTVLSDDAMESFVGDLLPNGVSADLTMTIVLPTWATTMSGGDSIVLTYRSSGSHDGSMGITGSESFSWDHAICKNTANAVCFDNTPDVVCPSTSKSCGYVEVDLDLSEVSFASLPITKGVSVEFALSVDLTIHRIAVPDSLFDSLNSGSTNLNLDVLPSDLLRALLEIGSRGDPLEMEFPLCDNGKSYCNQRIPFSSHNSTGLPAYANSLERDIEYLIRDASKELMDEEDNGVGNVDMSGLSVDIQFPYNMLTDNDGSIDDERGIVLSVDIPSVKITAGIDNSWLEMIDILRGGEGEWELGVEATKPESALVAPFLNPMVSAMSGLTDALSASMVSAEGVRTPEGLSIDAPTSKLSNIGSSELGLSLYGFVTVKMPLGVQLENLASSKGSFTSEIDNGSQRQVIVYEIAPDTYDDRMEFTVLLTPMWIISQIQFYLIGLLLFSLWRVRRRMTRRRRKRRAEALEALEESVASPMGYVPPQPTVEVLQVTDNGIVIKRRLVAT
tara:strand:+ start:415 stop:3510 length:3096 start_codon:yes stop_codon:yes gene_type:complete